MRTLIQILSFYFVFFIGANLLAQDTNEATTGAEALLAAAQAGDIERVASILESGTDVNSQSRYGATALYFACDRGNLELARLLLESGADPNLKDRFYDGTPMMFAQMREHYDVIKCLFEFGADGAEAMLIAAISTRDEKLTQAIVDAQNLSEEVLALAHQLAVTQGADEIVKCFANLDLPEATPFSPPIEALERSVGMYQEGEFKVQVVLDDKQLKMGFNASTPTPLTPFSSGTFILGQSLVTFSGPADKPYDSVTVHFGSTPVTLSRGTDSSDNMESDAAPKESEGDIKVTADPTEAHLADRLASSANWPGFRGGGSRGIAEGQKPPVTWDVGKNENIKWKVLTPGLGLSSPAIWEDRIFITSAVGGGESNELKTGLYGDVDSVDDDSEYAFNIYCFDKNTGEKIWERTAHRARPAVKRHAKSSHANPTIATNGNSVVAFFGSEGLYCYSPEGDLRWQKDLGFLDSGWFYDSEYQWGFASSPVIFSDRVIVQCDIQGESFVAAFNLENGQELWRQTRDEIPSWSSPIVHQFDDMPMLITHGTGAARGYDARDGQLLWELKNHSEIVVPTPFVAHDLIFICSGYRPVRPIYAIRSSARGDITLGDNELKNDHIAWSNKRGGPYLPSPIVYGDYLYTCGNAGILTCYQATTGKQIYKRRMTAPGGPLSFSASPLAADGHLYFPAEDGQTIVVAAGPEFKRVAVNSTGEKILATPAISDGVFYLRTQKHLIAVESTPSTDEANNKID